MEMMRFINILSSELSQTTANLLTSTFLSRHVYRSYYENDLQNCRYANDAQDYNKYGQQMTTCEESYGPYWDNCVPYKHDSGQNFRFWNFCNSNNNSAFVTNCSEFNRVYSNNKSNFHFSH